MFYSPKLYVRDLWISVPFIGIFLAQIYIWWDLIANIRPDSGQIFLHYNIIFGVDLVGDWYRIFYLPIIGLIMTIFNYIISLYIYGSDKFLARILVFWAMVVQIFLLVGASLIVGMNV